MDDPATRVAGVATQEDRAAFAASVARAEELLADRERRLDARLQLSFLGRPAIALMAGIMIIGAGLFAAGAAFVVFIGPGG
jgi:hypothetical protein